MGSHRREILHLQSHLHIIHIHHHIPSYTYNYICPIICYVPHIDNLSFQQVMQLILILSLSFASLTAAGKVYLANGKQSKYLLFLKQEKGEDYDKGYTWQPKEPKGEPTNDQLSLSLPFL